jgi:XTP/dITP diphosphohydrolase
MHDIVLATSNLGKIKELQAILAPINCVPQRELGIDDIEETGMSFVENALLKARNASEASGKPALADDSGLVVPAINGAPGIFSARFAGADATDIQNIECLLEHMSHLADDERDAYFYCAIVVIQHAKDPMPLIATGLIHGKILSSLQGTGGFGYDPLFYIPDYQCTMAELSPSIKNTISHRAKALLQLRETVALFHE